MTDIGSQLRAAREAQGLSVEQAFKATRIKVVYLEALEANRVSALPGPVQARGFVRSYANFLGLDGETLASTLDAMGVSVTLSAPKPIAPTAGKSLAPAPDRSAPHAGRLIDHPALPKISPSGGKRDTAPASPGGVPTSLLIVCAIVLFAIGAMLIASALSGSPRSMLPDSYMPWPVDQPLAAGPTSTPVSIALDVPLAARRSPPASTSR
jgi:cytoskeleton protein RodZ